MNRIVDWLGTTPGQFTVLVVVLLGPPILGAIFGWPRIPSWDIGCRDILTLPC